MIRRTIPGLIVLAVLGAVVAPATDGWSSTAGAQVTGETLVIAHRGASAYRPEHTFHAYDLAIEQDADFLECDLQLTRDEVLVCVHDATVDRTSDGSGRVDAFTLEELRELDWGSWFDPAYAGAAIVPLEEKLDCYLGHNPNMRFHIETKDPGEHGGRMEAVLVDLLTGKGLVDTGGVTTSTVMIQSFAPASLEMMRDLAPTLPTALLWPALNDVVDPETVAINSLFLLGQLPDYVDVAAPNSLALALHPLMVDLFHANGHQVHTWTVDDPEEMAELIAMGVDGIFTNKPDVLRAAVDAAGRGTDPAARGNPATIRPGCPGVAGTTTAAGPAAPQPEPTVPPQPPAGGDIEGADAPVVPLPRTGADGTLALGLAMLAVAGAFAVRSVRRRSRLPRRSG